MEDSQKKSLSVFVEKREVGEEREIHRIMPNMCAFEINSTRE